MRRAVIVKSSPVAGGNRATRRNFGRWLALAVGVAVVVAHPAQSPAAPIAKADLTFAKVDEATYRYAVHLQDTGATTIGTFWYAWVPGQDFLATQPTNIVSPSGWSAIITGGNSGNGFAIQWTTSTPMAAGSVLRGFGFDTIDTPSDLTGTSTTHPATPVGTTFVYSAAPFSDAGFQFLTNPTERPWTDPVNALDVNTDNAVTSLDALIIINHLNLNGPHTLAQPPRLPDAPGFFLDAKPDSTVTSLDALVIINALNAKSKLEPQVIAPEPSMWILSAFGLVMLIGVGLRSRALRKAHR